MSPPALGTLRFSPLSSSVQFWRLRWMKIWGFRAGRQKKVSEDKILGGLDCDSNKSPPCCRLRPVKKVMCDFFIFCSRRRLCVVFLLSDVPLVCIWKCCKRPKIQQGQELPWELRQDRFSEWMTHHLMHKCCGETGKYWQLRSAQLSSTYPPRFLIRLLEE